MRSLRTDRGAGAEVSALAFALLRRAQAGATAARHRAGDYGSRAGVRTAGRANRPPARIWRASCQDGHEKLPATVVAAKPEEVEIDCAGRRPAARPLRTLACHRRAAKAASSGCYVDDLAAAVGSRAQRLAGRRRTRSRLPADVWGVLDRQGDVDHFAFDAKAGQTLVFDLAASTIGSKANAVLTLFDAQRPRASPTNNDFDGATDPLLAVHVPADGRYAMRGQRPAAGRQRRAFLSPARSARCRSPPAFPAERAAGSETKSN